MYITSKSKPIILLKISFIFSIKNRSFYVKMRYTWHAIYHFLVILISHISLLLTIFFNRGDKMQSRFESSSLHSTLTLVELNILHIQIYRAKMNIYKKARMIHHFPLIKFITYTIGETHTKNWC